MLTKTSIPKNNKNQTMEETISLIFHGCTLARDLESKLPNLANQPNILSESCNDIIKVFKNARDRLNANQASPSHAIFHEHQQGNLNQIGAGVLQEWLRNDYAQTMGISHAEFLGEKSSNAFEAHMVHESKISSGLESRGSGFHIPVLECGGREMEAPMQMIKGSGGEVQPVSAPDFSRDTSSQRPRKRKDETQTHIVRIPAPHMGNIDIPPEDGYVWRKYGQKQIFNSIFPRSYYKCTHQKLYQCPAKKQVQRLDNDPYTLEVTYRGDHTCHMSPPAPPTAPPITTTSQPISPPSASMPLSSGFIDTQMQLHRNFGLTSDISGPSNMQSGRGVEQQPLKDLIDAMFYSGGCSNNSMDDIIFSSMESKWEGEDNKK